MISTNPVVCILASTLLILSNFVCEATNLLNLNEREYYEKLNITLLWSVYRDSNEIEFGIIAPFAINNGWIGFGLSMNTGMKGADLVIIDLYNEKIYDCHSYDFTKPILG